MLDKEQSVESQDCPFKEGKREVKFYLSEPKKGININTGFMLILHNWGGTYKQTIPFCDELSSRYNVITISVNYLQSGDEALEEFPYDHGYLQAIDCLTVLYQVRKQLLNLKLKFSENRFYSVGGSGGGNVTLMLNKFAPHTFACVVDIEGMPGLTDDIAYGKGGLNANYSQDVESPFYLIQDMQEIRNPGNLKHLAIQYKANPYNKLVIIHGLKDMMCSPIDKITIFQNMLKEGFYPDTHFLTPEDIDGEIIKSIDHGLGSVLNRGLIIKKFADKYLLPYNESTFAKETNIKNNFQLKNKVIYPSTNGLFTIDYSKGKPSIYFK